ncbi:MAG TPA: HD domain-containing phosphohydrolase [Candidatus Tumulicola sp.]|jgi:HD-GYP domain-containing protein (c-di-GMP phosphodiesterase class II)
MTTMYPGERLALSELASIVHDEIVYADRWAIVDWIRREMHAASPQQVLDLIDRAAATLAAGVEDGDRSEVLARLESLRSRSQQLVWEQVATRGTGVEDAIQALHAMIRVTDRALFEHLDAVGSLAGRIAHRLGLDPEDVSHVTAGARLCDIGAIGSQLGAHGQRGEQILDDIPVLSQYRGWVRSHHEYLDGSGTPDGLAESDIPFEVRIIIVADDFHSMVAAAERSTGMRAVYDAVSHLRRYAGTRYDARPLAVLEDIVAPRHRFGSPTAA